MTQRAKLLYEFGPFRLDATEHLLLRDGEVVPLTPKLFDILLALVSNSGHILEKDEMMRLIWPETAVEEANLTRNISTLRKALGENTNEPQFIETIPWRGYRFVANVREVCNGAADLIMEEHSRSLIVVEEEEEQRRGDAGTRGRWETKHITASPHQRIAVSPFKALAAGVLLLALGALAYVLISSKSDHAPPAGTRSIAVLPFKPMSQNARDEYLELGMADTLITKLSSTGQIIVRPTSAVRKYSGLEQDPIAAGRELKVESVLDGTIQKMDDRIRVTVRLVSVRDGSSLWAEKFDERGTNILAIQDSISERVAQTLAVRLSGEEQRRLTKRHTQNARAYQLYLTGRYFWNKRNEEGLKKAVEYFNLAIANDPRLRSGLRRVGRLLHSTVRQPIPFVGGFCPKSKGSGGGGIEDG